MFVLKKTNYKSYYESRLISCNIKSLPKNYESKHKELLVRLLGKGTHGIVALSERDKFVNIAAYTSQPRFRDIQQGLAIQWGVFNEKSKYIIISRISKNELRLIADKGCNTNDYFQADKQAGIINFLKKNQDMTVKLKFIDYKLNKIDNEEVKISSILDDNIIKIYADIEDLTLENLSIIDDDLVQPNSKDVFLMNVNVENKEVCYVFDSIQGD
jgi:hypothetical protein